MRLTLTLTLNPDSNPNPFFKVLHQIRRVDGMEAFRANVLGNIMDGKVKLAEDSILNLES